MKNFDKDFMEWLAQKYKQTITSLHKSYNIELSINNLWDFLPFEFQQGVYLAFFREKEIEITMGIDSKGYFCKVGLTAILIVDTGYHYLDCLKQAIEKAKELYNEQIKD